VPMVAVGWPPWASEMVKAPCPDCGGTGFAHCCEGECAQPQGEEESHE
jgi:hypothetical protein